MAEKMMEVYDAYDLQIMSTQRARGAQVVCTELGSYSLRIPEVNESRLEAEYQFKEKLCALGFENIDVCIRNKNDELATFDRYGTPFVLRKHFTGQECDLKNREQILQATVNLAKLHIACREAFLEFEKDVHVRVSTDYLRRNQELKRVYKYVLRKKLKQKFERLYLEQFHYFYNQALGCQCDLLQLSDKHIGYCHGMYNQHSVLFSGKDKKELATINFDRFYVGNQLEDLYHFARKTIEKNDYNIDLLLEMMETYHAICPIDDADWKYIYIRFCYPERFYKLSNQYMSSSKKPLSPKLYEKLEKVIKEESKKIEFLQKLKNAIS